MKKKTNDAGAGWGDVIEEIKRLRADTARREDEIWEVLDELRGLVAAAGNGRMGPTSRGAGSETSGQVAYRHLKRKLRRFVTRVVPAGGRIAVVSRGDEELLDLPGYYATHFPRQPGGGYTGFYPRDGEAAIAHFEWVRADGSDYLLFPATSQWWMEKYPLLAAHIEDLYPQVAHEEGVGIVYGLRPSSRGGDTWPTRLRELMDAWEEHTGSALSLLDWNTGRDLESRLSGRTVFAPPIGTNGTLPYLDGTVDVVAIASDAPEVLAEARRVARGTVVRFADAGDGSSGGGEGGSRSLVPVFEHRAAAPPALPSASIVIPTFNGIAHLVPCFRALDETLPDDFDGEVIAVDDESDPETAVRLQELGRVYPWLRVLRNEENLGFLATCNRGAQEATGDYVIFLNDDTVPLTGWLGALLRTFRSHPDAGAVGGRLVFPDGRLQEAGGLVFDDASGANFGRGDYELDAPLYKHVRRVDYVSGCLLATPRALFQKLGGFDTRYRPIYYEDTDYCFAVRRAGLQVYYQPEATIVHVEGATSGTDESTGLKRYQVRNRRIFRKKWRDELREQGSAPGSYTSRTWHRLALNGGDR